MKLICVNNEYFDPKRGTKVSHSLIIGKEYDILSVHCYFDPEKVNRYRVISEENLLTYPPVSLFEEPDSMDIPDQYCLEVKKGVMSILPKEWGVNYKGRYSFWEDFYDNHPKAIEVFDSLLKRRNIKITG